MDSATVPGGFLNHPMCCGNDTCRAKASIVGNRGMSSCTFKIVNIPPMPVLPNGPSFAAPIGSVFAGPGMPVISVISPIPCCPIAM